MRLLFSLFVALLLARTSLARNVFLEIDHRRLASNALHLPIYHARGRPNSNQDSETPLPFSDALALDEARVRFLNSRLANKSSTAPHQTATSILKNPDNLINPMSVKVPLNPGESLGIGNYYTKIGLGTPPTFYPVVVDTGSSFSWIQCEPCTVYCHPQVGSPFKPSASSTYDKLPCNAKQCSALKEATLNEPECSPSNTCVYTATYGDSSFSMGYLSQDSLSLSAGQELASFVFGCGENNDGLFGQSAGLIGLAKNELSILSQLSTKYSKAFSYCLPTATPVGKIGSGGFLSFGTSSTSYKFTPLLSEPRDPTLYFLKLSAVSVSGKQLGVATSEYDLPTIIDSGTTISRLAGSVYSALRQELVPIISSKYKLAPAYSILDSCFSGSAEEISRVVPKVQMVFEGGAALDLAPHNVIVEVEKGTTCLAFAGNSDVNGIAIIGNQQQQTFEVFYDVSNSRIGFALGGCR